MDPARLPSKEKVPGSSPGRRTTFVNPAVRWSKRISHLALNQETAGSNPARTTAVWAKLVKATSLSSWGLRVRLPSPLLRGSQVRLRHRPHKPKIRGFKSRPRYQFLRSSAGSSARLLTGRSQVRSLPQERTVA